MIPVCTSRPTDQLRLLAAPVLFAPFSPTSNILPSVRTSRRTHRLAMYIQNVSDARFSCGLFNPGKHALCQSVLSQNEKVMIWTKLGQFWVKIEHTPHSPEAVGVCPKKKVKRRSIRSFDPERSATWQAVPEPECPWAAWCCPQSPRKCPRRWPRQSRPWHSRRSCLRPYRRPGQRP